MNTKTFCAKQIHTYVCMHVSYLIVLLLLLKHNSSSWFKLVKFLEKCSNFVITLSNGFHEYNFLQDKYIHTNVCEHLATLYPRYYSDTNVGST
jgi:hypothetical protein